MSSNFLIVNFNFVFSLAINYKIRQRFPRAVQSKLIKTYPDQAKFSLLEIHEAIHRKSIGVSGDSGTDYVLNALMEKFGAANNQSKEVTASALAAIPQCLNGFG